MPKFPETGWQVDQKVQMEAPDMFWKPEEPHSRAKESLLSYAVFLAHVWICVLSSHRQNSHT